MDAGEASAIGARARMIRRRRGLSLDVVAGLAGITAGYLSMLERGLRGFNRRGLVEDLAEALGCSVVDLTGQPYLAPDRATVEGRTALPGISLALNDYGPDEVPDLTHDPSMSCWPGPSAPTNIVTRASTGWPGGIWARC